MRVHHFSEARTLDIASDIVVLGYDSENADYTNPKGAIHGCSAYVTVTAADGRRWAHKHAVRSRFESEAIAKIELLHQRMQAQLDAGGAFNPLHWSEIQAGYGSEAYQRDGWEQETIEWEKRCDEDESFGLR